MACAFLVASGPRLPRPGGPRPAGSGGVVVGESNPDKTRPTVVGYPVHRVGLCRPGALVLGLR